jgi:hypothetical protein
MQVTENDKKTTIAVLDATTKQQLIQAILNHPEPLIQGSNYTYHRSELAERVEVWLSDGYYPNALPRTYGIRIKAMELSGWPFDLPGANPEGYAAYKTRVLQDFDYFNVDEVWGP